ncbi:MAG: ribonuclease P protein component [Homoserinimonas sp.]
MPAAPSWRTVAPRDAPSFPPSLFETATVLARANRLVRAEDYRNTVRRGRRTGTGNTVVYVIQRRDAVVPRFGFIVSRAVGNAVARNLIRRRLKSVAHSLLGSVTTDTDIVIRALPGSRNVRWADLRNEVAVALETGARR